MPSIDEELLLDLYAGGHLILFAEQNNGYIWQNFLKVLFRRRGEACAMDRVLTVNTLTADGRAQFIHSATCEELIEVYGLSAAALAARVESLLQGEERMSVPTIHETEVKELDLPGRHLRWIVSPEGLPAEGCSACVIRVSPGDKVRPAHSEEVIYILQGEGRVLMAGEVSCARRQCRALPPAAPYTCCITRAAAK